MRGAMVDLRHYFEAHEVGEALRELQKDRTFQRALKARNTDVQTLLRTTYPLKYLGIEKGQRPRFPLSDVLRIALHPRRSDADHRGLRLSAHRKAFLARLPDVDALLGSPRLFKGAPAAPLAGKARLAASAYGLGVAPALERLEEATGVPARVSLQVLRKGLAAFRRGHRPGMSAHGWARARLSSFVMKGCTHFFPDHTLVGECPARAHAFWKGLPCLCHKPAQCDRYGKRTPANA